jgi:anti-sigma regulatory factor (Ser/Thr protein kinase)
MEPVFRNWVIRSKGWIGGNADADGSEVPMSQRRLGAQPAHSERKRTRGSTETPPDHEGTRCLALTPDFGSARLLRAALKDLCARSTVDEDAAIDFELAAVEAFNNGVRHGNHPQTNTATIQACLAITHTSAALELRYPGAPFNTTTPPLPDPLAGHGRGRYLMDLLTDRVEYEFQDGQTRVRLVKQWN